MGANQKTITHKQATEVFNRAASLAGVKLSEFMETFARVSTRAYAAEMCGDSKYGKSDAADALLQAALAEPGGDMAYDIYIYIYGAATKEPPCKLGAEAEAGLEEGFSGLVLSTKGQEKEAGKSTRVHKKAHSGRKARKQVSVLGTPQGAEGEATGGQENAVEPEQDDWVDEAGERGNDGQEEDGQGSANVSSSQSRKKAGKGQKSRARQSTKTAQSQRVLGRAPVTGVGKMAGVLERAQNGLEVSRIEDW